MTKCNPATPDQRAQAVHSATDHLDVMMYGLTAAGIAVVVGRALA